MDHSGYSCPGCDINVPWTYPFRYHPLPNATGGQAPLTYTLSPTVSGLTLDLTQGGSHIFGTPTLAGTYAMTYRVEDANGKEDELTFEIRVGNPYPTNMGSESTVITEPNKDYYTKVVRISGINVPVALNIFGGGQGVRVSYSVNGGRFYYVVSRDRYSGFVENGDRLVFRTRATQGLCRSFEAHVSTFFPPNFSGHIRRQVRIFDLTVSCTLGLF